MREGLAILKEVEALGELQSQVWLNDDLENLQIKTKFDRGDFLIGEMINNMPWKYRISQTSTVITFERASANN